MSLPCASATTLALSDDDLEHGRGRSSFDRQLYPAVQRNILIEFQFDLVPDIKDKNKLMLGSVTWEHKNSAFCGACEWCCLVQEASRRTLECVTLDCLLSDWVHSQSPDQSAQILIHLKILEYYREPYRYGRNGRRLETGKIYLLDARGTATLEGKYEGSSIVSRTEYITVSFEVYAEKDDPVARYLNIHRRPLDNVTLSESNLMKIKGWLKDCDTNHQKCKGTRFLPTRLLQIGAQTVRLISASTLEQNAQYIALSYCWGPLEDSKTILTTTHHNFEDRLIDIPIDVMPRTFQDVINVARALHISFIWIDSLCIIQDDSKDWQIESSRMADIYYNAYLTIIAAAGASCHDSFLYRKEICASFSVPFRSTKNPSMNGRYNLRYRPGRKWWGSDKMAEISGHQWITRGWTFQEERLAKRTLIFGENKFFFDCRTEEKVEDSDLILLRPEWTKTIHEDPEPENAESSNRAASHSMALDANSNSFSHWHTLCNHYSRRVLTFTKDKLPAISGMANKIHRKTGSDYLGGLWRDNFTHDLFWRTVQSALPIQRPEEYRAPSWSWAALDGQIRWVGRFSCVNSGCEMYCEILDVQVTVLGEDPFGTVSDGHLDLSAGVLEVDLSRIESAHRVGKLAWQLSVNGVKIATADLDMKDTDCSDGKFWAVLIAKCTGRPSGLLLRRTGGQRLGIDEYQRVGCFETISDILNPFVGVWGDLAVRKITII